jgi:CubicO group peptidase (beta-lactamase class C family)
LGTKTLKEKEKEKLDLKMFYKERPIKSNTYNYKTSRFMKSIILLLGIGLCAVTGCFGQNLSGTWKGQLTQNSATFEFELELIKLNQHNYNCISTILANEEYGVMTATCQLVDGNLVFKEEKILQDSSSNNEWCLKTGKLKYNGDKNHPQLSGTWEGKCVPGTIKLSKVSLLTCNSSTKPNSPNASSNSRTIVNGNFEQGYYGFNTEYKIATKEGPEQFMVLQDAKQFNPEYFTGTGKGCFMAIDASLNQQKLIWGQKAPIDRLEKVHLFSFDLSNININPAAKHDCLLQITANNKRIGMAQCPTANSQWKTMVYKFIPTSDTVEFKITNLTKGLHGNDFGIDNIAVKQLKNEDARKFELFTQNKKRKLATQSKQVDSLFAEYKNTPGCAVAVYSKGEILFKKGYGIANLDYDIKITPKTIFDIGSVSKQFTAACIVLLENEGKLSLDDDIRKYIPELHKFDEGKITIKNLLYHTSGLRDYLGLLWLSGISWDSEITEQSVLDLLVKQKDLNFPPGDKFLYSNSGYIALAVLVRRITGQSIGTFAKENIFIPLKMNNTFFYEKKNKIVKNKAIGYEQAGNDYQICHFYNCLAAGAGQVWTNVEDMFKWSENFKINKLGNDSFLTQMMIRGILNNGDTLDYSLGLFHGVHNNHQVIEHAGGWGGFRAHYYQFPNENLAIAVTSNLASFNSYQKATAIADIFLGDTLDHKADDPEKITKVFEIPETEFSLTQIEGEYQIAPGYVIRITSRNDTINALQLWNHSSYDMTKKSGNTYKLLYSNYLHFTFSELKNGSTQILTNFEQGKDIIWKRIKTTDLSEIDLKDYTGNYYSEELDVTYVFKIENETLTTWIKDNEHEKCTPGAKDHFLMEYGRVLRFQRKFGSVRGFELDAGRVKKLKFKKVK